MSKNQSRKGYVVGALVALVSTLFTVAPAQADANGPVTLLPTQGTTFNTLIGSPITLVSTLDPSSSISNRTPAQAWYVISNPDEADITITHTSWSAISGSAGSSSTSTLSYYVWDAAGNPVLKTGTDATAGVTVSSVSATPSTSETFYTYTFTVNADMIAVPAWIAAGSSASPAVLLGTFNGIKIDSLETSTTTVKVQTLLDYADGSSVRSSLTTGAAATFDAALFDLVSKEETVNIYAPSSVPVTTTINNLVIGSSISGEAKVTVAYGLDVNPYFVSASTKVGLFKDGTVFPWSTSAAAVTLSGVAISSVSSTTDLGYTRNTLVAGIATTGTSDKDFVNPVGAGIYSAQAYYNVSSRYDNVTVGAASAVWNAAAGSNTFTSDVKPEFINTLDANFSTSADNAEELRVRSGTKVLTLSAQIYSGSAKLSAANVEVWARVAGSLDATTTVTVTGAAGTLVKAGTALNAYGRTDTTGRVSFVINSTTGKKADALSVELYAKISTGAWVNMSAPGDVDIVWEDAEFDSFTAKPATYISGANPTVTFKVTDQFGKGLSTLDGKALSVYAEAAFAGVAAPKTYSNTVLVANGEAKFTFVNFAPAGGLAQLQANLYSGGVASAGKVNTLPVVVNVYNTAVTDRVTVAESFDTAITYADYVTGDTEDPVVAKAVEDANLDDAVGATISGNVLNATGVGQPGVAVTLAAKGVLFLADGVYSLDTVTTNANEFGAFSVKAIAHMVSVTGATVSITADGKTASTKLVTYLPTNLEAKNLKFSWTLPATVVKNTTYAVTLALTDKWGNPVSARDGASSTYAVRVQGAGSVEVNSSASALDRDFDRNGQVVVFLRSVKDIAGPGSITATLGSQWDYPQGKESTLTTSSAIATSITSDDKSTAWNETLWSNTLTSNIEVLDSAPASAGKVNVGSFNGKLVVYAANLNGARISWKVGGNWGSAVATSNYAIFNRPTPRAGVTVSVEVFVNGVKTLTKSVVTR